MNDPNKPGQQGKGKSNRSAEKLFPAGDKAPEPVLVTDDDGFVKNIFETDRHGRLNCFTTNIIARSVIMPCDLYFPNRRPKTWFCNCQLCCQKKMLDDHARFTQGLFYFLANDERIAASTGKAWSSWGYCREEFKGNKGFPRLLYVRDGRRMVSYYVITEKHTRKIDPVPVEDPVAVAYWPPDLHSVRRIVKDGFCV